MKLTKPSKIHAIAWIFVFMVLYMFALGEYPAIELAEAREKCQQVADGVNPAQDRQLGKNRKANNASNTFELIAREWLQMKNWAEITKTRRLDML